MVAAGGVIRDDNGRIVSAFATNLGTCSIMRAELRGIGIKQLRIQTDSKVVVDMLTRLDSGNNHYASLIGQFFELSSRD
ncbi:hypothetical protein LINPERHAP2_LOCUS21881 [Linum perenne]